MRTPAATWGCASVSSSVQWAGDFTEHEAAETAGDGRAPNPLLWHLGHLACTGAAVVELLSPDPSPESLVPDSLRATYASGGPVPTPQTHYLRGA